MKSEDRQLKLFAPEEAALFLNLKISRLRSAIFKKEIPFLKIGRLIRFSKDDLIDWIEQLKQETQNEVNHNSL